MASRITPDTLVGKAHARQTQDRWEAMDDRTCDRCGTDIEAKLVCYPGDGCAVYRLCELCGAAVEDAIRAFVKQGGDDDGNAKEAIRDSGTPEAPQV